MYAEDKIKEGQQIVEVRVDGHEDQLKEFQDLVENVCPPAAKVAKVSAEEHTGHVMNIDRYLHLLQIKQLEKGIDVLQHIDGKQDQALGKMDTMIDKQDQALGKMDTMIIKQDQTIAEIKGSRIKIKEYKPLLYCEIYLLVVEDRSISAYNCRL